jgi:hypothetical protein
MTGAHESLSRRAKMSTSEVVGWVWGDVSCGTVREIASTLRVQTDGRAGNSRSKFLTQVSLQGLEVVGTAARYAPRVVPQI